MTEHLPSNPATSTLPMMLLADATNVGALRAAHARELEQLRMLVSQLLAQLKSQQQDKDSLGAAEGHVAQLREANEHLVHATFGAQDMLAAAEGASQRQSEFLSMLAHELRNPLQPMGMVGELLGSLTSAHADLPRLHAILVRQLKLLVRLVDDLFDASRIHNGKVTLTRTRVSLGEVLDSASETCHPMLGQRHQQLLRAGGAAEIWLDADAARLAQVFANLILNASKFSVDGSEIFVCATTAAGQASVSVLDHGIGIAPALQPFIFDLFTQGISSLAQAQGGLGLGLALVRSLVEMHGGTVRVISAGTGLGSEFIVQLPLARSALSTAGMAPLGAARMKSRNILLIEDDLDASDTLAQLLEQAGHVVTRRFDGVSGLAALQAEQIDIVLCDIGLSGLDGVELARLALAGAANPHACFIATTGYCQPEEQARALAAGFQHYLIKPLNFSILMTLIEGSVQ